MLQFTVTWGKLSPRHPWLQGDLRIPHRTPVRARAESGVQRRAGREGEGHGAMPRGAQRCRGAQRYRGPGRSPARARTALRTIYSLSCARGPAPRRHWLSGRKAPPVRAPRRDGRAGGRQ